MRRDVVIPVCLLLTLLVWVPHAHAAESPALDGLGGQSCNVSDSRRTLTIFSGQATTTDSAPDSLRARLRAAPAALASAGRGNVTAQNAKSRNWIQRHPVLFGALVGYMAGFVIGYAPGDDAVFYDFTAEFNGFVLGGVGAAIGAVTGAIVGR